MAVALDQSALGPLQDVIISGVVTALLPRLEAIEASIGQVFARLPSSQEDLEARIEAAVGRSLAAAQTSRSISGDTPTPQMASGARASANASLGTTELASPARPSDSPELKRNGAFNYCVNRGARSFDAAFRQLASERPDYRGGALFTYFDTYGGKQLPNLGTWPREVRLIERSVTNDYDNKRTFAQRLQSTGCEGAVAKTYFSVAEALSATEDCPDAIFFVKSAHGTAGKDMRVMTRGALQGASLGEGFVIQRGVQDLTLVDGRKFVVRFFMLVHDGALLAHRRAIAIVHGPLYDRMSESYMVQICHSTTKPDSQVRCCPLERLPQGATWHRAIASEVLKIAPALQPLVDRSSRDHYCIVGLDALIDDAGVARIIEANMYPNLWDLNEEINCEVKMPMLRDVLSRVLLGESPAELQPMEVAAIAA